MEPVSRGNFRIFVRYKGSEAQRGDNTYCDSVSNLRDVLEMKYRQQQYSILS
jgi:hypothetical protein